MKAATIILVLLSMPAADAQANNSHVVGGLQNTCHAGERAACAVLPSTIPALQEWHQEPGVYQLTERTRIVRDRDVADALATTSRMFAEELGALIDGHTLCEAAGTPADPAAGDIFLTLAAEDHALGHEGIRVIYWRAYRARRADRDRCFLRHAPG